MRLTGGNLREVSFPVGGIGAGCIGISGAGRLVDWEIFNHAGKNLANGCSHFAVRAERDGKVESARILNGDLTGDLTGSFVGREAMFRGFGWGPSADTMCGLPHFREVELDGAFPAAEFRFADPGFPGKAKLTAWSPFVPGNSELASLPCAMFEIELTNNSAFAYDYSCIGVLENFWNLDGMTNRVGRDGGLTRLVVANNLGESDFERGELALSTDAAEVSFQEYFYRGGWCDYLEVYWNDLTTPGKFRNRHYDETGKQTRCDAGLLAAHLKLGPGETGTVRFILSWHIPNRRNTWDDPAKIADELRRSGLAENRWRNYYAVLCPSAATAAARIFTDYQAIRQQVFTFRAALHDSTVPAASLEGAAENLAVLISPTCLRLEDGSFWAWEGVGVEKGSCPGSCQHVWNYAQALPLLFPDLERSMREAHLKYGLDERGGLHFRQMLPAGIQAQPDWFRPCVDGAFGEVMKCFREWKISGDTAWLRPLWPKLKQVIEFAWSPANPDRWDPEQSGILTGRQHHTLDMELFGPSGWLNGHYLGALKAAAAMAEACGDPGFADLCCEIFARGSRRTEEELFNGEYYIQKVDLDDPSPAEGFVHEWGMSYFDAEHGELKYQIGEGCSIDSHLGQWYASLYGIGKVLDPAHNRATLEAIHRYNFVPSLRDFANTWRVFALNDEGGTMICRWPEGKRKPVIPIPYNSEAMTGFEWAAASHLVMTGHPAEGEAMAQSIRDRYRGGNRNPWNEIECGSNYARAMASYAMLQAYSGFCYDMTRGLIGFAPVLPGDFRCFWSLGTVWGVFERRSTGSKLSILGGSATFRAFGIAGQCRTLPGRRAGELYRLERPVTLGAGDDLEFS